MIFYFDFSRACVTFRVYKEIPTQESYTTSSAKSDNHQTDTLIQTCVFRAEKETT